MHSSPYLCREAGFPSHNPSSPCAVLFSGCNVTSKYTVMERLAFSLFLYSVRLNGTPKPGRVLATLHRSSILFGTFRECSVLYTLCSSEKYGIG